MKESLRVAITVIVVLIVFMISFTFLNTGVKKEYSDFQHEIDTNADPTVGATEISPDHTVDQTFSSHLPIVVLDLMGNEIPNIYMFSYDGTRRVYNEEGLIDPDPWTDVHIQIIDSDGAANNLTDTPLIDNYGKIKLRGMTTRTVEKKNLGIKLLDGEEKIETKILGMGPDSKWVLSNSVLDFTGIRNYVTMNIGRKIFPYTPESQFCELIMKDNDTYTYQGLYLLDESIRKGEGHINIDDFDDGASLNYIICRDRYNESKKMLSTWASDQQLCYGYFSMVYPDIEEITTLQQKEIENEISVIEKCLYEEDYDEFLRYSEYIDVDSFVDYFLINEFFMNYDAGNNSTYYYKTRDGKLAIGPLWDYDNCWDNYRYGLANTETLPFCSQPWFEKLVYDRDFQKKLVERYKELRKGVLSEEYIFNFIDDTMSYLGNAQDRNVSRWGEIFWTQYRMEYIRDEDGIGIDRNKYTLEGEVQRMKDLIYQHGRYMDYHLEDYLKYSYNSEQIQIAKIKKNSWIGLAGVILFLISIVLVSREVRGQR